MDRSSVVRLFRVVLPLVALALLSGLFLLGRQGDERHIPYATGDGAADVAPGIVAPTYTTVTAGGDEVSFHAGTVTPEGGREGRASGVRLDWRSRAGLVLDLDAAEGQVTGGRIALGGAVRLDSSTGYRLETERLLADTDAGVLSSDAAVTADAPFGRLTAGGMRLSRRDGADVLDFTGGVRLLYRP